MGIFRRFAVAAALWLLRKGKYADEATKNKVLSEAVKHLLNAVGPEDILKENPDGTIQFEGKLLMPNYRKDLREQAKLLPSLLLWRVLQADIKYRLNKKMFTESLITADVMWGKLLLWMNDVITTRLEQLKK